MPKSKKSQVLGNGNSTDAEQHPMQIERVVGEGPRSARRTLDGEIDFVEQLRPCSRFTGRVRKIDLNPALGRGMDEWVFASAHAIRNCVGSGNSSHTGERCGRSMLVFFEFLNEEASFEGRSPPHPKKMKDMTVQHGAEFVAWLKRREITHGYTAQYNHRVYRDFFATVLAMFELGLIRAKPDEIFKLRATECNFDRPLLKPAISKRSGAGA